MVNFTYLREELFCKVWKGYFSARLEEINTIYSSVKRGDGLHYSHLIVETQISDLLWSCGASE